jgi:type VI secretion system secreted protein Hcp
VNVAIRNSIRRLSVVALVVVALGIGFVIGGRGGASSTGHRSAAPAPTKTRTLGVADLLAAASTATGIHLHYQGITSGASTSDHSNDIPIQSFSYGNQRSFSNPSVGPRQGSTPSVSEITLSHQNDKYSLPILNVSLRGNPGANASIFFTDLSAPGGLPFDYLEVDLTGTQVSGFQMSSGGDVPSESFSLNFLTMSFKYRISGGTTTTVNWNLSTNS